jgi:hypothetical protein
MIQAVIACVLKLSNNCVQRFMQDDRLCVRRWGRISKKFAGWQNRTVLEVEVQPILRTHGATHVISLEPVELGHEHTLARPLSED